MLHKTMNNSFTHTIAVDGPAASGKGTIARRLAQELGYYHLDTGLLYRAVGWLAKDQIDDELACGKIAAGLDPSQLRDPGFVSNLPSESTGELASRVSVYPQVRTALLAFQRKIAILSPGAVLDGRDIGTVVCPDAGKKLFITATIEIRAQRRWKQLISSQTSLTYEQVLHSLQGRDQRDSTRSTAPLKKAADALLIDSSHLTIDEVYARAIGHIRS
ncbi:MAG: (d)CMP kinase [Candidatus Pacebacteria bacterium]|nr:(d)CMP kinase [Candidatus Paceibacterota bacterium]